MYIAYKALLYPQVLFPQIDNLTIQVNHSITQPEYQKNLEAEMAKTIQNRREAQEWHKTYDPLAPKAGDVAPDFELKDLKGENPVQLSSFRGQQPVALVFGSFT